MPSKGLVLNHSFTSPPPLPSLHRSPRGREHQRQKFVRSKSTRGPGPQNCSAPRLHTRSRCRSPTCIWGRGEQRKLAWTSPRSPQFLLLLAREKFKQGCTDTGHKQLSALPDCCASGPPVAGAASFRPRLAQSPATDQRWNSSCRGSGESSSAGGVSTAPASLLSEESPGDSALGGELLPREASRLPPRRSVPAGHQCCRRPPAWLLRTLVTEFCEPASSAF